MLIIRRELAADFTQRESLLDRAFGKTRWRKTSERLRQGRVPSQDLAYTALDKKGRVIGTLRLWNVIAGSAGPALLLGPLAIDGKHQKCGIGQALMERAINEARARGHGAVVLVGDEAYYSRFGFSRAKVDGLRLPGPVDRGRLLGLELLPGALNAAEGLILASGRMETLPRKAA